MRLLSESSKPTHPSRTRVDRSLDGDDVARKYVESPSRLKHLLRHTRLSVSRLSTKSRGMAPKTIPAPSLRLVARLTTACDLARQALETIERGSSGNRS